MYRPEYDTVGLKRLKKLCSTADQRNILNKIRDIATKGDEWPYRSLRKHPRLCRFRHGPFRVYYAALPGVRVTLFLDIDHKDQAYGAEQLSRLEGVIDSITGAKRD